MASRARLAAIGAALALLAPATGLAADPVETVLSGADVYVSASQLGQDAPRARTELEAVARELEAVDRPVKLAVVAGRGDATHLLRYARHLRRDLDYDGTLALTTPGGAVAVAAPRSSAETTDLLRRARVGQIAGTTDRLVAAAEVGAAPRRSSSGTREILILIALAAAGGAWAVAVGAGRRGRRARQQLAESRAAMRVHVDVLRARASALLRGGRLPEEDRPRVQAALGTYAEAIAALQQASSAEEVADLGPRVEAGLEAVSEAARDAGEEWGSDPDPFAGLCAADPAHGLAAGEAPARPGEEPIPLCARCLETAEGGEAVPVRMVPAAGRPVPYTETAGLLRREGGAGG